MPAPSAPRTRPTLPVRSRRPSGRSAAPSSATNQYPAALRRLKRAREIDDTGQRHALQRPGRGLGERGGFCRRAHGRQDDGARAESLGRAEHRADIARIADPVEQQQAGRARRRSDGVEVGRGQRVAAQRDALMDGAGAEPPVQRPALDGLDGNAAPAGSGRRLSVFGLEKPVGRAGAIGKSRRHRMTAMKPELAASRRPAAILRPIGH